VFDVFFWCYWPLFYEHEAERIATVNGAGYKVNLSNEMRHRDLPLWFQQVEHTAHPARINMEVLHRLFSHYSGTNWSTRSPDLSAKDLILCGCLNTKVHESVLPASVNYESKFGSALKPSLTTCFNVHWPPCQFEWKCAQVAMDVT
jgi:hypothetical protein